MKKRIIVVGAGAGGMMAAGRAAELGEEVLILEKMPGPGRKILVSGKTRCNLTNSGELENFISAFGPNGRFLYSAFNRFFREDLLELMLKYGVETKVERGGRIFPASDNAGDVVLALKRYLKERNVKIYSNEKVNELIVIRDQISGVQTENGEFPADAVVLATGGASWPATGSTGDGYRMAERLGHKIIKLKPALVPLIVKEIELVKKMQGISLKNVRLTAYKGHALDIKANYANNKIISSMMGEMMITHFGIGGPLTLQMSLDIVKALEKGPVAVAIDLKPALTFEQLQMRLQREFDSSGRRTLKNILKELLPQKLIEPIINLSGIPGGKNGHQINAIERDILASLFKSISFNVKGPLPLSAAMVTAGGVSLDEIDPRTMASKLIKGLYFCGEVMDINADTGGFNLQAAFSTGFTAGESAAAFIHS